MVEAIKDLNRFVGMHGIFHDTSVENEARADGFLKFLQDHPEIEGGPRDSFEFSVFRDSIVCAYLAALRNGKTDLIDIIREKAPFLADYPEQLDNLLAISTNDANETLKRKPW